MSRVSVQATTYRTGGRAITPSDTVDNVSPIVGLYVGGAGNVSAVFEDGDTALFTAVPVGTVLPFVFRRINATGTTATNLVGGK